MQAANDRFGSWVSQSSRRGQLVHRIAKYLFPKAAGLSASAAAKLDNGDKLAALLLKRKYRLASGAGSTINQVLEAVVCKELGVPEETTSKASAVRL